LVSGTIGVVSALVVQHTWGAEEEEDMGWIIALVMGGIMGWLASKVMNRDADMGIMMNVIVGCVGSIIGRFALGGFLGGGRLRDSAFDPMTLLTSFIGAVVLLGVINLVKRGSIR
jgi:uncharacterized membrane protein YeaQ/YmgE (transglycosylase-associated protein family)